MNRWFPFSNWALFVAAYVVALLCLAIMNKREFKRCPEKGARYKALPVGYKLSCWFFVVPLFAGIINEGLLFIPAVIAFAIVEAACVRWYRKAGLL